MANATFAKLNDGSWGLRHVGEQALCVGDEVFIARRAGGGTTGWVSRVLWTGQDRNGQGTVTVASFAQEAPQEAPQEAFQEADDDADDADDARGVSDPSNWDEDW